jgi:hypothetical protein
VLVLSHVAEEYDMKLAEDYAKEFRKLEDEIYDLKEKISRLESSETIKVTTNDSLLAWNGLIPGSDEAVAQGCTCPIIDNQEMPEDKKWVNMNCPLHGRKSVV